jgi:hypothetical protein
MKEMRKFEVFFCLLLNMTLCQAQLLSNPDLSIKDIEIALKNPDHLRGILLEHHFNYLKLDDQPCKRADMWESKEKVELGNKSTSEFGLVIYEWNESAYPPYTNAIVTIEESLRNAFPIRNIKTRNESQPFLVYSKPGSKIEVELATLQKDFNTRMYEFTIFK